MIIFSLQKNRLWSGTGFIIKSGLLELSSMCFAEHIINAGSGKYKIKLVGSSISGNGILSVSITLNDCDIITKQIVLNSRSNTELSFDIELNQSGAYKLKLSRGRESIGRASIGFLTISKYIEPSQAITKEQVIPAITEKTYFVIDYDNISSPSDLSNLFLFLERYKNCFFLVKTSEQFTNVDNLDNFRLFFEYEDLFEFLRLVNYKKLIYLPQNIDVDFLTRNGIIDAISVSK